MKVVNVYESHALGARTWYFRAPDMAGARHGVESRVTLVAFDLDEDHPGCADAMSSTGRHFVFETEGE